MKKAFTLVELLVVIGIIGILAGVLIASFSGSSDSARAAKCLTNLKNLASANQLYGSNNGHIVNAYSTVSLSDNVASSGESLYYETPGWVSWYSRGVFPSTSAATGEEISTYSDDDEKRIYCLTNGALWKYISGNSSAYVCAQHINAVKGRPLWSYVENQAFCGVVYTTLTRADRMLLFAEMPFDGSEDGNYAPSTSHTDYNDCTLKKDGSEMIGFNHKTGKGAASAHVVFADGHVEKLRQPTNGLSTGDKKELTKWLCEGKDISFDGREYEKLVD